MIQGNPKTIERRKEMKKVFLLMVGLVFIGVSQVNASLLVGNLDQSPQNLWNNGVVGQAFTTGDPVTIDSATFRYDYGGYTPTSGAYLEIRAADTTGQIDFNSGGLLDTWNSHTVSSPLVTYTGTYDLAADTTYWLVLNDPDNSSATYARVSSNTTYTANFGASLPTTYNNYDNSGYYSLSEDPTMFEVNAVPIPSALLLLGSGLIGLVGVRRKLRK
jgi:hypothetical protein